MNLTIVRGQGIQATPGLRLPAGTIALRMRGPFGGWPGSPVTIHVLEGGGGFAFSSPGGEHLSSRTTVSTGMNGDFDVPEFVLGRCEGPNRLMVQGDHAHALVTVIGTWSAAQIVASSPPLGVCRSAQTCQLRLEDRGFPSAELFGSALTLEWLEGGGFLELPSGFARAAVSESRTRDHFIGLRLSAREETSLLRVGVLDAPIGPELRLLVGAHRPRLLSCGSATRTESTQITGTGWLTNRIRLSSVDITQDTTCGTNADRVEHTEIAARKLSGDVDVFPDTPGCWSAHSTLGIRATTDTPFQVEARFPDYPDDPPRTITGQAFARWEGPSVVTTAPGPRGEFYVEHQNGGVRDAARGIELLSSKGDVQFVGPNACSPKPWRVYVRTTTLPDPNRVLREITLKFKVRVTPINSSSDSPFPPTTTPGTVSTTPGGGVDELRITIPGAPGIYPVEVYFNANQYNYDHAIELTAVAKVGVRTPPGMTFAVQTEDTTILARSLFYRPRLAFSRKTASGYEPIGGDAIRPSLLVKPNGNIGTHDASAEIYVELRSHDVGTTIDAYLGGASITLQKIATADAYTLYRSKPVVCFLEDAQAWGLPTGFTLPASGPSYVACGPPFLVQASIASQMPANPLPRTYPTPERPLAFLGVSGLVQERPRPRVPRPLIEITNFSTTLDTHPIVVNGGKAQLQIKGVVRDLLGDLTPGGGLPSSVEVQGAATPLVLTAEPATLLRPQAKRGEFDAFVDLRPGAQIVRIRVENDLGGVSERSLLVELVDPRNAYEQPRATDMFARVRIDTDPELPDSRSLATVHYWAPHGIVPAQVQVTCTSEGTVVVDEGPLVLFRAPGIDNVFATTVLLVDENADPFTVASLRASGTPIFRHRSGTRLRVHVTSVPHPAGAMSAQAAIASEELVVSLKSRRGGATFLPVTHVETGEEFTIEARFAAPVPVSSLDLVVSACDRLGQLLANGTERFQRVLLTPDPTTGVLTLSAAYDATNQLIPISSLRAITRSESVPANEVGLRIEEAATVCVGFSLRSHTARFPVIVEPTRLEVGGRPVPPVLPRGHSLRVGVRGTVVAATGELVLEGTDATSRGRGMGLAFVRHYNSFTRYDGPMGHRWSHAYDVWLRRIDDDHYRLHTGAAQTYDFYRNVSGAFDSPAGIYALLEVERRGDARLSWPGGMVQTFAAPRRDDEDSIALTETRDATQNRVVIARDQAGALLQVVDPLSERLYFRHDDVGRVIAIGDATERLWEYAYYNGRIAGGQEGDLQSVTTPRIKLGTSTFPRGRRVVYTYLAHRVSTVQDPLGHASTTPLPPSLTIKYDGSGRVERQIQEGGSYGFVYGAQISVTDPNTNVTKITPLGLTTLPMEMLEETANATLRWRYDFNGHGELTSFERPAGGAFVYDYDAANPDPRARGNLLRIEQRPTPGLSRTVVNAVGLTDFTVDPSTTDPASLVWAYTYEPRFQQLATTTDPLNHVTTRRYDYQLPALARGRADGNLVELEEPTVRVGVHAGATGRAIHRTLWNNFGQPTHEIDPNGVVSTFEYFTAAKPNGPIGAARVSQPDLPTGGLARLHRDVTPTGLAMLAVPPLRHSWLGPLQTHTQAFAYDRWGNLTRRDCDGQLRSTHEYNEAGEVIRTACTAGEDERLHYDANGRLIARTARIIDVNFPRAISPDVPRSVTHRFEYDRRGNPTKTVFDDGGLSLTFVREFDGNSNLRFEVSPLDAQLPRAQRRRFVEYKYDERDLLVEKTIAPLDTPAWTISYGYDDDGEQVSVSQPDGLVIWTTRDAWGRHDRTIDADHNGVVLLRDAIGRVCCERRDGWPDGGPGARRELAEAFVYRDEAGRPVALAEKAFRWTSPFHKETVGTGRRVTAIERDDAGHALAMIGGHGRRVSIRVDGQGSNLAVSDPTLGTSTFAYDGDGNLVVTAAPGPRPGVTLVTKESYDAAGNVLTRTTPDGGTTIFAYDNRGLLRLTQDAAGNRTFRKYDAVGRLVRETRELREHGRLRDLGASVDNALITTIVTDREWDANSNLLAERDGAGGLIVSHTYGVRDERLTTTLPADDFPSLQRDDNPGPNVWSFEHDTSGRQHVVTTPDGIRIEHGYLPNGNLVRRTITAPAGTLGSRAQTFTYDGARRLIGATDDNGGATNQVTTELTWDSLGNLWDDTVSATAAGSPASQTASATYDERGYLASHIYNTTPGGLIDTASYVFDEAGRMESLTNIYRLASYAYQGRFLERRSQANLIDLKLGHDDTGRLATFGYESTAWPGLPQWKLQFDDRGLPVVIDQLDKQTQDRHLFDSFYRMIDSRTGFDPSSATSLPLVHTTYDWDKRGNRIAMRSLAVDGLVPSSGAYTYRPYVPESVVSIFNQAGQIGRWIRLTQDPPTYAGLGNPPPPVATQLDMAYDARGNLAGDGSQTYAHDALNRLVSVTDAAGTTVASFLYDALGRRVLKKASVSTRFIHHGKRLLEETETLGSWSKRYYYHSEGLLAYDVTGPTGATYRNFVHADRTGSILFDTEETGAPLLRYAYDPATGRPSATDANNNPVPLDRISGNHFLHQARYFDTETGLYLTGVRYAHPLLGDFLERDPLGADSSFTPYGFAGGNPLAFHDPSGAIVWWAPIAILAGLAAIAEVVSYTAGPQIGQLAANFSPVHSLAELVTGYEMASLFTDWRGHDLTPAATVLNILDVATAGLSVAYGGLVKASTLAMFATRALTLESLALKVGIAEARLAAAATFAGAVVCFHEGAHGFGALNLALLLLRTRGARPAQPHLAFGGDPISIAMHPVLHRITDDFVERHAVPHLLKLPRGTARQIERLGDNGVNGLISEGTILTAVRELHPDAHHQLKLTHVGRNFIRYADTYVPALKLQIEVKRNLSGYGMKRARRMTQWQKDVHLAKEEGVTTIVVRHLVRANRFVIEGAHHASPGIDLVAFADILRTIERLGGR